MAFPRGGLRFYELKKAVVPALEKEAGGISMEPPYYFLFIENHR